ncbi:MAG: CDP-alcohol phosphatidyltransferase family protein [Acidimicrobiales bacterium]
MDRAEALGAERVPLRAETVPGRGSDTVPVRASDILPQPANSDAVSQPANSQSPTEDEHLDRVFTVPNLITMVRLACIPLFLWLLFGAHRQTLAAVLLGVLGATDWVDGHVARRFHQVSTLGKVLDPVADRILVGTSVISIIVYGAVPVWFGVATIVREVVVSVAVLALASLGAKRIDVLWVGKAGTFALMFSYPAFLLSYGSAQWQTPFHVFAWVSGIIGLVLAWIAAGSYIPVARQALADGRRARAASDPVAANSSDTAIPIEGADVAGPGSEVTR